ncbi:MAG: hypothetical protein Q7N95_06540, partial [Alphaproteobacteria bacterium]|nr:hypothetical protein [Alphaproteobacteria bacterium]
AAIELKPLDEPEAAIELKPLDEPEAAIELTPLDEPGAAIELKPLDEPEAAIELTPLDELDTVERPVAIVPTSHAMRLPAIAVREEIQRRVAAFRAHQQLFQRERDDYFNSVLAKAGERTSSQPKVQQNK